MKYTIDCVMCETPMSMADSHYMLAIEVPYLNLFFHKDCYINALKTNNILDIIRNYIEIIIINKTK